MRDEESPPSSAWLLRCVAHLRRDLRHAVQNQTQGISGVQEEIALEDEFESVHTSYRRRPRPATSEEEENLFFNYDESSREDAFISSAGLSPEKSFARSTSPDHDGAHPQSIRLLRRILKPYLRRRHRAAFDGTEDLLSAAGQLLFCLGKHSSVRRALVYFLGYGAPLSLAAGMALGGASLGENLSVVAPEVDPHQIQNARSQWRHIFALGEKTTNTTVSSEKTRATTWTNFTFTFPLGAVPEQPDLVRQSFCPDGPVDLLALDPDVYSPIGGPDPTGRGQPRPTPASLYRNVFEACRPKILFVENSGAVHRGYEWSSLGAAPGSWHSWQGELEKEVFHGRATGSGSFEGWVGLVKPRLSHLPGIGEKRFHAVYVRAEYVSVARREIPTIFVSHQFPESCIFLSH